MHSWMAEPFIGFPGVTDAPGEGPRERSQTGAAAGLGRLRVELCSKEALVVNSSSPCHVSACFMILEKRLPLLISSLDAIACASEKKQDSCLFPSSLGGIMRKSTFNLLRRRDKMAICMYNLSGYVLVTITAEQDIAGGEAEVETCYIQDCISSFLCNETNQGLCYLTVTVFLSPVFFKQ